MTADNAPGFRTFMNAPFRPRPAGSKAAVLGCPWDYGQHTVRIGSRLGPGAIREQSLLLRPNDPESGLDLPRELNLADAGDAAVTPSQVEQSFAAIEAAMTAILEAGAVPVAMGGDGMISLPQMRALAKAHGTFAAIHIDAHTDAYPMQGYNPATTFIRAAGEGLLDTETSFHIGMRGTTVVPKVYETGRELGYNLVTLRELRDRGTDEVVAQVRETVGKRPVYLCFDMDFFDPSVAPGVCTPEWNGATTREGFDLIDALSGFKWIGFDCNTVSPPHDVGGMTALLAATVMLRFLAKVAAA